MANVSVSNTTGLYIGSGAAPILNNAQQLLSLLSNNGGVTFSLDPAYGNSRVEAFSPNINSNIAAYLPTYSGLLGGTLTTAAQPNITSVGALTSLVVTGNITSSANVQANYFIGNGSLLTGLPATYGNANVAAYLPTYTGNLASLAGNVTTSANVQANYFIGNGSLLTGIAGSSSFGNANVAAYLPTYTGNLVSLAGNVITSANVTGSYFIGNGSLLTGIAGSSSFGNANVAAYLPTYTGNLVSLAGNVITSANVTGSYFIGNGSLLTGITSGTGNFGNANVAAYLPTYSGNIGGDITIGSNLIARTGANVQLGNDSGQGFFTNVGTAATTSIWAPFKLGSYTLSAANGTPSSAMGVYSNIALNRTNDNTSARVKNLQMQTVFDANGYSSSIGVGYTDNNNTQNSAVSPGSFLSATVKNSQGVSSPVTMKSAVGWGIISSIANASTYANITTLLGIDTSVGVINDTTSVVQNTVAYRAQFLGNDNYAKNKIVLLSNDTAANILIAGNIVSSAANVVAVGGKYSGNVTAAYFLGNGSQLTGISTTPAAGTVFNPFLLAGM